MSLTLDCQGPLVEEVFFEGKHLGHWTGARMVAKVCFWIHMAFLEENLPLYLSATVLQGACGYDAGALGHL